MGESVGDARAGEGCLTTFLSKSIVWFAECEVLNLRYFVVYSKLGTPAFVNYKEHPQFEAVALWYGL